MEIILIILCILFISCNAEIKGSYPGYMKFRNYALRLLISEDYNKLNKMFASQKVKIKYLKNITSKKILKIYDKALSKYYDSIINYSSLSEDDKTIIETILSMSY
jgi:hypothetical protein